LQRKRQKPSGGILFCRTLYTTPLRGWSVKAAADAAARLLLHVLVRTQQVR